MKIGIKYCGGCNPRYDRCSLFSKLIMEFGRNHTFEIAEINTVYDLIFVLCGCKSCCADCSKLKSKYCKVFISGEEDYKSAVKLLQKHTK